MRPSLAAGQKSVPTVPITLTTGVSTRIAISLVTNENISVHLTLRSVCTGQGLWCQTCIEEEEEEKT